jgi:hypothetical protein
VAVVRDVAAELGCGLGTLEGVIKTIVAAKRV